MGIFDFFKKKPPVDDSDPFAEVKEKMGGETRPHHYTFAHRVLPEILQINPLVVIELLQFDQGNAMLLDYWQDTGERLPAEQRLPATGLRVALAARWGEYSVAVIDLPEPLVQGECYSVGMVWGPMPPGDLLTDAEAERLPRRYFTLKRSVFRGSGTMLGEWGAEGHDYYGEGPQPGEATAFAERMVAICREARAKGEADGAV